MLSLSHPAKLNKAANMLVNESNGALPFEDAVSVIKVLYRNKFEILN